MDQLSLQAVRLLSYVETCRVYHRFEVDSRSRSQRGNRAVTGRSLPAVAPQAAARSVCFQQPATPICTSWARTPSEGPFSRSYWSTPRL